MTGLDLVQTAKASSDEVMSVTHWLDRTAVSACNSQKAHKILFIHQLLEVADAQKIKSLAVFFVRKLSVLIVTHNKNPHPPTFIDPVRGEGPEEMRLRP
jgi:hypothetical protein